LKRFFRFSYKSETEINATQQTVWKALVDSPSYPKWNPFTVNIQTSWTIGQPVSLTVQMKPNRKPMVQTEYLSVFQQPERLAWGFSYGWMLRAMRTQQLIIVDENKTKYINEDIIEGLLSPIVHVFYGRWIQKGFDDISLALKNYMENHGTER
jgi:uncharacterized protein YndB with AHSA1/START domain